MLFSHVICVCACECQWRLHQRSYSLPLTLFGDERLSSFIKCLLALQSGKTKKTPLKASCSSAASYLTLFGSIVFGSGWVRLCQTIYNTILSLCLGLESLPNLPHTESDIWATYRHRNTVRWIMHKKSSPKRQQRPTYLNLPISCSFVWKMLVQGPMRNLHPRATSH